MQKKKAKTNENMPILIFKKEGEDMAIHVSDTLCSESIAMAISALSDLLRTQILDEKHQIKESFINAAFKHEVLH